MKRLFALIAALFLSVITVGIYFTNRVMYIKKKDDSLIINRERNARRFIPGDYHALPKKEITIPSSFGYSLKAVLIEPYETNRYVIICHGVTENKINSVKYMNLFIERGFNCLIYDQRRHGESGGKTTSYGYYEKFDLKSVVDWLKVHKGDDLILGIHGESMGAVTMLLYAGELEDGAHFYIADCPFSDLKEQLAYRLKTEMKLPPKLFLPIANVFLRIRDNYSFQAVSPISIIDQINKPVLFIHSKKDDYILPSMTKSLYERKKGPKKLFFTVKGAHAQSFNENREEYEKAIDQFLLQFVFTDHSKGSYSL